MASGIMYNIYILLFLTKSFQLWCQFSSWNADPRHEMKAMLSNNLIINIQKIYTQLLYKINDIYNIEIIQ